MTITSRVSRVDYVGNGVTTAFAVPFPFFDNSEIRVLSRVIATGVETELTLTTHYTVTGGGGTTGTVTAVTAPASTVQWSILRNTRCTQDVDYQANDPFPAETHERALDRVVATVQEIERDAARSIRVAATDSTSSLTLPPPSDRANRNLGFDSSGNPVAVVPEAGSLTVTAFGQSLIASSSAANGRIVLGASNVGAAIFTSVNEQAARIILGAPAIPVASAGAGQFATLENASGFAAVLPPGGTWAYWITQVNATTAAFGAFRAAGTAAGGTTVGAASAGSLWYGFCWRIL